MDYLLVKGLDLGLHIYRVPTRSRNREKVGNFVIGRDVGKNKTP